MAERDRCIERSIVLKISPVVHVVVADGHENSRLWHLGGVNKNNAEFVVDPKTVLVFQLSAQFVNMESLVIFFVLKESDFLSDLEL